MLAPEHITYLLADRIETSDNEHGIDDVPPNRDAEVCKLNIDVVEDGALRFNQYDDSHYQTSYEFSCAKEDGDTASLLKQ
ncbi:hypothetical protein EW145_g2628 [Phellinidium pouzarii]|uniref:Uncharacterized protein n=1 Tax=Phellinidium pouzarii TaxID=167371 RepID=A0A4S4LC41_9AGAM|nr:hypothetical protein EW145_g2628 [Phellinidium pouzarii]